MSRGPAGRVTLKCQRPGCEAEHELPVATQCPKCQSLELAPTWSMRAHRAAPGRGYAWATCALCDTDYAVRDLSGLEAWPIPGVGESFFGVDRSRRSLRSLPLEPRSVYERMRDAFTAARAGWRGEL